MAQFYSGLAAVFACCCAGSHAGAQTNDFWMDTAFPLGFEVNTLAAGPADEIFAGTEDAGIRLSSDDGQNWNAANNGLADVPVLSLAIHPTTRAVFAGTFHAGVFRSTNNGGNWTAANTGLLDFDSQCLAIDFSGQIFAGTAGAGVFRSDDGGEHWLRRSDGLLASNIQALAVGAPGQVFAGTAGGGVFHSTDYGDTWAAINNGLTNLTIQALAVNSRGDIFAGTLGGGIYRSIDAGANWSEANSPDLHTAVVACLAINSADYLFAGVYSRGVFFSANSGNSWVPRNSGLLNSDVAAFTFDAGGHIFAGTNGGGIYRSVRSTTAVRLHPAASFPAYALEQNYPNPANPATTIAFSLPRAGKVVLTVYNTAGNEIARLIEDGLPAGRHEIVWSAQGWASGVYYYRLQTESFVATKKLVVLQ